MNYDVIITFETLEEDSQYLIEQCGLDDRFETFEETASTTDKYQHSSCAACKVITQRSAFIV